SMLAAVRPELFGPLMVVGAPLSYWAGSARLNPMRYSGATLGGAWLAALAADLAGDRFDGAHLVHNFENLNPANTWWSKYFRLWCEVDDEAERFLAFERWWGGFFRMTGAEIESIVENLFVGNRLARGAVKAGDDVVDLRHITAPVVVFASWGDNITPPPQALNWIIDTWGSERAIAAAGRVIVYVLHETVGHLGIFVGADIARKEHDQIVNSLDVIENLPPGLYEMKVERKDGAVSQRWDELEPGSYSVHFEHRTMDDLRALNPEGRDEERLFSTVARLSEINTAAYKTWVRPWLRALPLRPVGDALTNLHPVAAAIAACAERVRDNRHRVHADHPARRVEHAVSAAIEGALNLHRDLRDQAVVQWTRLAYGPLGLGAWLPPEPPDEHDAVARARAAVAAERRAVLERIGEGGFERAIARIVLAGMVSTGRFERRSFRLAGLLARLQASDVVRVAAPVDWRRLLREEARIAAVAPVEALNALAGLLPDRASREQALAVAAAVMMLDPPLDGARSEIIELLVGTLGVDPERVMALAGRLTSPIEHAPAERTPRPRAPRTARTRASRPAARPARAA
ncbi:MAG TPA: DUF3141 domain-containing protein, partial [Albitalea sp.]